MRENGERGLCLSGLPPAVEAGCPLVVGSPRAPLISAKKLRKREGLSPSVVFGAVLPGEGNERVEPSRFDSFIVEMRGRRRHGCASEPRTSPARVRPHRHPSTLLPLLALLLPLSAHAVPPDARLSFTAGEERFVRPPFKVEGLFVEPEGFVAVDALPSDELFVSVPKAAHGAGTLFVYGAGRVAAFELCVGKDDCPGPTNAEDAKSACPDLARGTEDGAFVLRATVKDARCLDALKTSLRRAELHPKALRLVLEEGAIALVYKRVTEAVAREPGMQGAFVGPTLTLGGKATRRAFERVLRAAWLESVGAATYDADALTLVSEETKR